MSESHPVIDLFEYVQRDGIGLVPKRANLREKGIAARYFYSLMDGFTARFGGRVTLFSEDNEARADLGMVSNVLTLRVLDIPVLQVTSERLHTPVVEVGEAGRSWIELWGGENKWYVHVTKSGKLSVRKTPPQQE